MKKLFAIVLSLAMAFMLLGFTAQAKAVSKYSGFGYSSVRFVKDLETENDTEDSTRVSDEVEDGLITLELIQSFTSWKVLVNTTTPMGNYKDIENQEDLYSVFFIECCDKRMSMPVYHDMVYVSSALGGISLNDINYDRLMDKFQAIVDVYNNSNELQLTWEQKFLSEEIMQVDINSTNLFRAITKIGQQGVLREGASYFESSWNDGSGKCGNATSNNPYIPDDFVVTVNGFSYLDENRRNITKSYYVPYEELGNKENAVEILPWERHMLQICTPTGDIGWVYAEDVDRIF